MTSAPPGRTVASLTKYTAEPPDFVRVAPTVMLAAVVLAKDKPIKVAVWPDATVGVTVVGVAATLMFAVASDLKAINYPSAMAIAIAIESVSAVLYTLRLLRAVVTLATSLRLLLFSILSVFKLEKLLSTSVLVSGDPFTLRNTMVDIRPSY
jgi:hypothetical protein